MTRLHRQGRLGFLALLLLTAAGGCMTRGGAVRLQNAAEAPAERQALTLTIAPEAGGRMSVSDDQGTYQCDPATVRRQTTRVICHRGVAQLDLLLGGRGANVAILYPAGYAREPKTFFRCAPAPGSRVLSCSAAATHNTEDGRFVSPFPSTVDGIAILNAHVVQTDATGHGLVLRGMEPRRPAEVQALVRYGVKAVLIFKDAEKSAPIPNEITAELAQLKGAGIQADRALAIPFKWKKFDSFAEACRQTVQALQFLTSNAGRGVPTYFHCTIGEDRTGYLAALYQMLTAKVAMQDVFAGEMCEHGYGGGNPQKPYSGVIDAIDRDLTPIFLKMAHKIEAGELTKERLDPAVCASEPSVDPAGFKCPTSLLYQLPSPDL